MTLTPATRRYFHIAGVLGFALMVIDTWLAFKSGITIDTVTGCIYALVSLGSGIMLVIAGLFYVSNFKAVGRFIAALWVPVFCFNVWSQIGMHTSARMTDVQQASVQSEKRGDVEKEKQELEAERIALVGALENIKEGKGVGSGWSSTRPVSAWKADISNMEGDKVFARSKQCANVTIDESRKFCDTLKELRANLAAAEKMEETERKIAAANVGLAKVREKLAHTDPGHSTAENSSTIQAKILAGFDLASKPGASQITIANEGSGIMTAFLLGLLAALFILIDAYPHLLEAYEANQGGRPRSPPSSGRTVTASTSRVRYGDAPALPQPLILNHTNTEDSEARKAASAAQDALNSLRHQLAQAYGSARTA
jgi:hypothetical protein